MPYRRCGRSGLKLPAISLGLWQNFGDDRPLADSREILRRAFDLGITHFDLANNYGPPYGSAEINFGRVFAEDFRPFRDELIISTKAGYDMWPGPYGEFGSRKYLLASLDQSLHRLGLEYVDIFYSHRFDPETPLDPVTPWAGARLRLFGERLDCAGRAVEGGVAVSLARTGAAPGPVGVEKLVTVAGASLGARYRLRSVEGGGVNGRFAVQWNLALTAGDAEGRYLTLPDRPSLGSAGRARGLTGVSLVDEWIGVTARLAWRPVAELAWAPVQTVSVSEAGFERIYQGTALLLAWPVALAPGEGLELSVELTVGPR